MVSALPAQRLGYVKIAGQEYWVQLLFNFGECTPSVNQA